MVNFVFKILQFVQVTVISVLSWSVLLFSPGYQTVWSLIQETATWWALCLLD